MVCRNTTNCNNKYRVLDNNTNEKQNYLLIKYNYKFKYK